MGPDRGHWGHDDRRGPDAPEGDWYRHEPDRSHEYVDEPYDPEQDEPRTGPDGRPGVSDSERGVAGPDGPPGQPDDEGPDGPGGDAPYGGREQG